MMKPKIRFNGFTDDWEQRKLEEIYQNIGNAFVGTATPYYVDTARLKGNKILPRQTGGTTLCHTSSLLKNLRICAGASPCCMQEAQFI